MSTMQIGQKSEMSRGIQCLTSLRKCQKNNLKTDIVKGELELNRTW